ncbi:MAG: CoB--CoM heterodisulfide reductase iron-sulfur subunit A family protein [Bacteroidales bacterium]|nr:CoB--CoM heterodisulfide reductase iron-sulfur subunit A family protein [Bacteroidales bacterium]
MRENERIGIFFCITLNGNEDVVDIFKVAKNAEKNSNVSVVWYSSDISLFNVKSFASEINNNDLKRLIIAGNKTGDVKSFLSEAMFIAGKNPENILMADFNEYGANTKADTEKAKAIVECAILGVPFEAASVPDETSVCTETLVIGGGIAGIQASLEIANGNQKVYLLERTGTIGGHMAMFDKTFPTLDCAACILTPKMVEVGQHPNIELMTYCEVKGIKGVPGNYKVRILKKAKRVNLASCIACGTCSEKCPGKTLSEFDADTNLRKAIYIPFPQAVPNKYLIDADSCIYVQSGKCGVCVKVCPVDSCINLDEKDEEVEITVGNIIVATGFKVFDAKKIERFGYGKFPNVITSLELERLVNAAGPTGGNICFRTRDKKGNWIFSDDNEKPKSFALIHCIGSRDENYNKYCSRVCCMYSLKLAHLIKEKSPDSDVFEYYIDMRAFGKGYEEFYNRIKEEGVNVIRGKTAKIEEKDGQLLLRTEDVINDRLIEQKVDMVVLAVGLEPREDTSEMAKMLGISTSCDGWFLEANSICDLVGTYTGGITIAGACQGPKDIPDTIAQASAAASHVLKSITKGKINKNIKDLTYNEIVSKAKEFSSIMEDKS